MKKRILGLLVALCLIVGLLPMAVLAEDSANLTIGQAATYTKVDGATDGYYLDENNEQIPFGPAPFWYVESGATDANWQDTIEPKFVMNPGDPAKYFTTTASDTSNPDYTYMNETQDTENWNVKIEYPMGGTPTMTLKGATIKNGGGIAYGARQKKTSAGLKIVVETDSVIDTTPVKTDNTASALALCTDGDVTITGAGKLSLRTNNTVGAISFYGDLLLDHANVYMTESAVYQKGGFIQGLGAESNVTIKGGTIFGDGTFEAAGWPNGAMKHFVKANDLTIEDAAKVTFVGSAFNSYDVTDACMWITGELTIKDSDVELVAAGGMTDYLFVSAPILEGVTAVASGSKAEYNYETGEFTAPSTTKEFKDTSAGTYLYFKAEHTHVGGTATCSAKAVCDVCGEGYGETLPHTYERTSCDVDSICSVCNQVAVAAGEHVGEDDGNCATAVKCSTCGAQVTAAKEHTYDDEWDDFCNNEGCTYDRFNNTTAGGSTGSGTGGANPETGDSTNLVMLFTLLAVSALGLVSVLVFKKKAA